MIDSLPNSFAGSTEAPTDDGLTKALGASKAVWDSLVADLSSKHGVNTLEWKSYSVKNGWSARLTRGKRTIVWLGPCAGCFQVMFILGGKAMAAAREAGLSARALKVLDEGVKYPEGTGVRFTVKNGKDSPSLLKLAAVKIAN